MSRIPWRLTERVAGRAAGRYPLEGTYHMRQLAQEAPGLMTQAAELAVAETGLSGFGSPGVEVVTRSEWASANVSFFAQILGPAEETMFRRFGEEGKARRLASSVSARLVAVELGTVLGFLARRVLGQYELVLPREDRSGDTVLLVGANVLRLERIHQFRPADFRLWIALHESTHRLQFHGIPWLQGYFLGLVHDLVSSSKPEAGRLGRVVGELRAAAEQGRPLVDESGLFGILASDQQRALIDKVQALMSLLEGHGHVVMDRIGSRLIKSHARMARILRMRRNDPRMQAFLRLSGLELKLRQYELGERFVRGVELLGGWSALDAAWRGPEFLPSRAEIEDPEGWLSRVA
ncbi:MAG TPA: zinc-dependent metalloprotease [Acidimicrobiia bacterium]